MLLHRGILTTHPLEIVYSRVVFSAFFERCGALRVYPCIPSDIWCPTTQRDLSRHPADAALQSVSKYHHFTLPSNAPAQ